jgi:hypothetical protein
VSLWFIASRDEVVSRLKRWLRDSGGWGNKDDGQNDEAL